MLAAVHIDSLLLLLSHHYHVVYSVYTQVIMSMCGILWT